MTVQATITDFLQTTVGNQVVINQGVWVRLHNNNLATDTFSTGITGSLGQFTFTVVPGDYSLFWGPTATVGGTPNLANAHYRVAYSAGDDAAFDSATASSSGPYTNTLPGTPGAQVATPAGVQVGAQYDYGGLAFHPMAFGAIGDGTAHLLSERYASVAAAQVDYPFITTLSSCIDYAAIEAASRKASAAGGGAVTFPYAHFVSNRLGDSIVPRSFVRYTGTGKGSILDFTDNVFFVDGMSPNNYDSVFTFRVANAISAGDRTITLQTIGQAADFVAPCLAVLRSVAEDSATFPCFVELVKVTSVNYGTGVLTLEEPLEDALADPEVGVSPFAATGTPIPEGTVVDHLYLKADYTQGSDPLRFRGCYKGKFHDLWLEGAQLFSGNGYTRCTGKSLVGISHYTVATSGVPGIELKSGSYRTTISGIKGTFINEDGTTAVKTLISTGERDRHIVVEDFDFYAPSANGFIRLWQEGAAVRGVLRNGRAVLNFSDEIIVLGASDSAGSGHVLPTRRRVENLDVNVLGTYGIGVNGTDSTNASEHSDVVRGLRVFGTCAATNALGPTSVLFGATNGLYVYDSIIPGLYRANSGSAPLNSHLYNTITDGPLDRTTRANVVEHNALWTNSANTPSPAQLFNSTQQGTSANNPILTLNVPAHFPWLQGDKVKFRIAGTISGTNNTKNVAIADPAGTVLYTLVVAAGTTGAFEIEGYFVETSVQNVDAAANFRTNLHSCIGATLATQQALSSAVPTNATMPFVIQAWVVNASDSVFVAHAELQYVRAEDSLTYGSTEGRS